MTHKPYQIIQLANHLGGAKNIIKHHSLDYYLHPEQNSFVLLDGDEKPKKDPITSDSISKTQEKNINSILAEHTGVCGDSFNLPIEQSKNTKNSPKALEQKITMKKGILDAFYKHFRFMNIDTPEELIWCISEHTIVDDEKYKNIPIFKDKFKEATKQLIENVDSGIIYKIQESALFKRNINHHLWLSFKEDIKQQFSIIELQD